MMGAEISRRKLVNALVSLPATLVWLPICGHYLFVSSFMIGLATVSGVASTAGGKPLLIALGMCVWCVGGLVGLAALWCLIVRGDELKAAGGLPWLLLRGGLWTGFVACVLALALAAGTFWRSGFNWFLHSLFLTVLGPMAVFLRELPRPEHAQPPLAPR